MYTLLAKEDSLNRAHLGIKLEVGSLGVFAQISLPSHPASSTTATPCEGKHGNAEVR